MSSAIMKQSCEKCRDMVVSAFTLLLINMFFIIPIAATVHQILD